MTCPNCQSILTIIRCKNNLAIDHCSNCGASLFRENELNRLTWADARRLAQNRTSAIVSGDAKLCPRDKTLLAPMVAESIPQFVTLLQCDDCRRIFAFPDDLLHFKQAQNAKINYFKTWGLPLPSLRAVLVFSFVLAISVSIFKTVNPFLQGTHPIKATNDLCALQIAAVGNSTILYCSTKNPYSSEARFKDELTGQIITRSINTTPNQAHMLTITDADIANRENTSVQFVFQTPTGELSTEFAPLQKL